MGRDFVEHETRNEKSEKRYVLCFHARQKTFICRELSDVR